MCGRVLGCCLVVWWVRHACVRGVRGGGCGVVCRFMVERVVWRGCGAWLFAGGRLGLWFRRRWLWGWGEWGCRWWCGGGSGSGWGSRSPDPVVRCPARSAGMAIIVWGCAKVGYRSEPLLELLLDRLRKKKFRQQLKHFNIVDLMWAVGELGFVHQKLMTCMAYRYVLRRLSPLRTFMCPPILPLHVIFFPVGSTKKGGGG